MNNDVEEYLKEGIYGAKQTKPGERRRYLGTLRERIVLMLSKGQVMQQQGMDELVEEMKEHPEAELLMNGKISNRFRKKYAQLADQHHIHATSVLDQEKETDVGVLLVVDYAIEKETIEVDTTEKPPVEEEKEKGVKGFLKRLFRPL
ncbi:YueI family protein [Salimicrobium sp. PL1-032A]|uniref:YueI family protein n=1 Tax=Salimicrobium sp. PL1-032A TaxID=3095364 RepID=UPI0032619114